MSEHNPDEPPRTSRPIPWIGPASNLGRGILLGILLGAAGFVATPIGIMLLGRLLRPFERNVAQGYYTGLTWFGLEVAPLGGLYWLVAGILLGAGFVRVAKAEAWLWLFTLATYSALVIGSAAYLALTF